MPKPAKTDPSGELPDARPDEGLMRVWDPLVRLFHWSLVAVFSVAWLSSDLSEAVHMWAGYAAGGLIVLRVIWGLIGPRYARFSSFVRHPRAVAAYLGDIRRGREARHIGHNPAGGAMILALILALAGTVLTGWMMYTDAYYGVDWVAHLHGLSAHAALFLVIVHLGGVALASLRHRENLVSAMIFGKKRAPGECDVA